MGALKTLSSWLLSNGGPLMGGISGIFSVFSADKKGTLWRVLPILGVVIGMFWALASANFADRQQREQMEGTINRVDAYIKATSAETVSQMRTTFIEVMQRFGVLPDVAQNATPQQALDFVNAGTMASALIRALPPERRNALTIRVFPHAQKEVDYQVVKARLQQLARTVEERGPIVDIPTNSVWWGDGSNLDEAKAAALTVVSAGLQIRQICESSKVPEKNLIQIGGSIPAQHLPILSPSQIDALPGHVCQ